MIEVEKSTEAPGGVSPMAGEAERNKEALEVAEIDASVVDMGTDDIITRNRLLESDIRVMKSEILRMQHEASTMKERLQDNLEKIKLNKQLPYLVSNIVEILEMDADASESGPSSSSGLTSGSMQGISSGARADPNGRVKCAVVKTSTRTVCFSAPSQIMQESWWHFPL